MLFRLQVRLLLQVLNLRSILAFVSLVLLLQVLWLKVCELKDAAFILALAFDLYPGESSPNFFTAYQLRQHNLVKFFFPLLLILHSDLTSAQSGVWTEITDELLLLAKYINFRELRNLCDFFQIRARIRTNSLRLLSFNHAFAIKRWYLCLKQRNASLSIFSSATIVYLAQLLKLAYGRHHLWNYFLACRNICLLL